MNPSVWQIVMLLVMEVAQMSIARWIDQKAGGPNKVNTKGDARMPTFKFNSDKPSYQNGWLVKKVETQQSISLSATDCTILGWTAALMLGKLTLALIFKRNPYRLL